MRQQQGSGLYQYLNDSGVLASGNAAAIAAAKRQYWSKVRSNWNKAKRKRCKSYTLLLEGTELRLVQRAAKQHRMRVTGFIKAATLQIAGQGRLADKATIGEVRQALMNHYNTIETYTLKKNLDPDVTQQLLHIARTVEVHVMKVIGKKVEV